MKTLIDYQSQIAQVRLCPIASDRGTLTISEGNAKAPWLWNAKVDSKLNTGKCEVAKFFALQSAG